MTSWELLGARVRGRRQALGLSQRQAALAAGISDQTWLNVEQGKSVADRTLVGVNRAISWAPGSAEAVLDGGEPIELVAPDGRPATRAEVEELRQRLDAVEARLAARDRLQERFEAILDADEHAAEAMRASDEEAQPPAVGPRRVPGRVPPRIA